MANTGYNHSIKLPQIYKKSSKLLEDIEKRNSSITSIYNVKYPAKSTMKGLISKALYNRQILNDILNKSKLLELEPRMNQWIAKVLIVEMCFNKKSLIHDSKPMQTILKHKDLLMKCYNDILKTDQVVTHKQITQKPRYVRVNTLKISLEEAINEFENNYFKLIHTRKNITQTKFIEMVKNLNIDEFMVDIHVENLLIFHSKTKFYDNNFYLNGYIILQDKASCLPAILLNPKPNSEIMDLCAAPGMKTTLLASLINNNGIIYSIELKPKRFEILKTMVENTDSNCVQIIQADALQITGESYPNVEYILVDPTCSSSGITEGINLVNIENDYDRLKIKQLVGFQIKILSHALESFPKVNRVVYSTCSIFPQENEVVVWSVLKKHRNFQLIDAKNQLKVPWINSDLIYGSKKNDDMKKIREKCIYAVSDQDLTTGFFVAVFEKKNDLCEENNNEMKENYNFEENTSKKRKSNDHFVETKSKKHKKKNFDETFTNDFGKLEREIKIENVEEKEEIEEKFEIKNEKKKKCKYDEVEDAKKSDKDQKMKKKKYKKDLDEEKIEIIEVLEFQNNKTKKEKCKSKEKESILKNDEESHKVKKKKHKENFENVGVVVETQQDKIKKEKYKHDDIEDTKNIEKDDKDKKIKKKKHKNKENDSDERKLEVFELENNKTKKSKYKSNESGNFENIVKDDDKCHKVQKKKHKENVEVVVETQHDKIKKKKYKYDKVEDTENDKVQKIKKKKHKNKENDLDERKLEVLELENNKTKKSKYKSNELENFENIVKDDDECHKVQKKKHKEDFKNVEVVVETQQDKIKKKKHKEKILELENRKTKKDKSKSNEIENTESIVTDQ